MASTATKENVQNRKNHDIQLTSTIAPRAPPALHRGLGVLASSSTGYGQSTCRSIATTSSTPGSCTNSSHRNTSSEQSLLDTVMAKGLAILNDTGFYEKEKEIYAEYFMGKVVSLNIQCYEKLSEEYGLCEDRQQLEAERRKLSEKS